MQGDVTLKTNVAWALSYQNRCYLISALRIWVLGHWHLLALAHCEFILLSAVSQQKPKSGERRGEVKMLGDQRGRVRDWLSVGGWKGLIQSNTGQRADRFGILKQILPTSQCYLVQPSSWMSRCFINIVPFVRILEMAYKNLELKSLLMRTNSSQQAPRSHITTKL